MKSIVDLLTTIAGNPHIAAHLRAQAQRLKIQITGQDAFGSIFGVAR